MVLAVRGELRGVLCTCLQRSTFHMLRSETVSDAEWAITQLGQVQTVTPTKV